MSRLLSSGDAAFDAALRAAAPAPLTDDGFTERTLRAIEAEARRLAIARALACEERHHAARRRLWHWTEAGAAVGLALLAAAVVLSPGDAASASSSMPLWAWWSGTLTIAAAWFAWHESRGL